ncbi:hypothetical protein [Clostridium sp. B9]|uniref:hypothetical protein n=1 Tax=Clostridium sp. B9 TaxID=3423224 RepID=UPI003D2EB07E
MNQTFIYYAVLLIIIFITINNILENLKYSPKKLKLLISIAFIFQLIRGISLIVLALVEKQNYIGFLKYTIFFDLIYIPLILMLAFYVFLRSDRVNFNIIRLSFGILSMFYLGMIVFFKPYFKATWEFGYLINVDNEFLFKGIYLFLLSIIISFIILYKKEKHSNNTGIIGVVFVGFLIILENSLGLIGLEFLNACLISEVALTCLCFYFLTTFKKNIISVNG